MKIDNLFESLYLAGINLDLTTDGNLHYSGDATLVKELLPTIRNHKAEIIAKLNKVNKTYWCWMLHFAERESIIATFSPEANQREALEWFSDCIAAKPVIPPTLAPSNHMNLQQEASVRSWLEGIWETDQEIINEVLRMCRADAEVLAYYMSRAIEEVKVVDQKEHLPESRKPI